MKILITGGAGFIGCNAAARYLNRGWELTVLDDLSRRGVDLNLKWLKDSGSFEFIRADIRNYNSLLKIFTSGKVFDVILHLAAQVAVTTSINNPREDFEINALGTLNLLEAIRNSGQNPIFLYSSTNKVYGNLEGVRITERKKHYQFQTGVQGISEQQPLDFHSPYGCSKGCADQYVRDYARIYGLRTVVFRQSCIYGSRQFGVEDQGWVAWFIIAAVLGRRISIYGDGKQVRDILHIDDLLDCFDAATNRKDFVNGQVYNIGGGPDNQISLLEFLDLLSRLTGGEIKPKFSDWRHGDQKIYVSDISKAKKELRWVPKVRIEKGIQRIYGWILKNRRSITKVLNTC